MYTCAHQGRSSIFAVFWQGVGWGQHGTWLHRASFLADEQCPRRNFTPALSVVRGHLPVRHAGPHQVEVLRPTQKLEPRVCCHSGPTVLD